ncbi:MAG TPA: BppU family phage baseplate upper protein [Thermoanaerobacterales bacterium]|nr:BppU family phage baseplate upper protein [Thermoanaerobacterales bacterium]
MFVIKQGDTLPMLEAQLFDPDGNPLNLDLCGVHFYMKNRYSSETINKQASIKDIENGIVQVIWEDGDTSKAGIYQCEFEVNMPDGSIITVPNDGYFLLQIVSELA